jgi:ubiquinone/menaquinone biosynthesis C-methylase UbiE
MLKHAPGKKLLDYGCGTGDWARELAAGGATVTGIDVSDTAIELARACTSDHVMDIDFRVMDAENLAFEDQSFDLICGTAILHHLRLEKAYSELARTLKPAGVAVFLEPLGHNFLINLYRKLTPGLRTRDEQPLRMNDIRLAGKYFESVETRYFHFTSILSIAFRNFSFFARVVDHMDDVDRFLFRTFPFLRKHAWIVVIEMSIPRERAIEMKKEQT